MLQTLITSKTRIKLLLKFFLNSENTGYLKNLESEFDESSNGIRLELNRLEAAGLLKSNLSGNKKLFKANTSHPMFLDIHSILMKYTGIDRIVENVVRGLGNVHSAYLVGDLAKGRESNIIDIVLVGDIDREYLTGLIKKAESLTGKRIKYLIYTQSEFEEESSDLFKKEHLIIWSGEK